ncbi:hypothetical protein [Neobacillus sp. 114]|nr:hypothetical protein [Neobacillus sp. 114]
MNEQSNNEQSTANQQNTIKSSNSQPIVKKSIQIIKHGGCGCGKRRQI